VVELALAPAAAAAVVAGLGVELRLFAPSQAPRRGEAILWSTGWLLLAVAVAERAGPPASEPKHPTKGAAIDSRHR
jgi:hypothetical protein